MPEKRPEKCVSEQGKPIGNGVLRFLIQGKLIGAGVKGLSVDELITELEGEGATATRLTIGKVIAEITELGPPYLHMKVVVRRTGPLRLPKQFFYIVRYQKKNKTA